MNFARLQAPAEDGEWLAHPDPGAWRDLVDRNRTLVASSDALIGGRRISAWRDLVRAEAAVACDATPFDDRPVVVSGHQPEPFHPGVWIKNFAASGFAQSIDGRAIHVVTDSDLLKRTTLAVPGGTLGAPLVAHLPFDQWTGEEPFEDREVRDEEIFASFEKRAVPYLAKLPFEPILSKFWRYANETGSKLLTKRFYQPRQRLEFEWGCVSDETTMSRFCQPDKRGFFLLAADVMLRAAEYRTIYNDELLSFRRREKVRSSHHPAPELIASQFGVEVPFWAWKAGGRRMRPFVASSNGRVRVSCGGETILDEATAGGARTVESVADALANLTDWKIRPRALMTTTFLRLGLADLFIHGLGGAKYDEWNDAVISRFWKIEPPAYVMLTATRRLPLTKWDVDPAEGLRNLQRLQRDLQWNPERHLDDALLERPPICDWLEEKFALREEDPPSKSARRARYRRLRELTGKLREFAALRAGETEREIERARAAVEAAALMGSREFFFGFHPKKSLLALFRPWLKWKRPPPERGSAPPQSL